MKTKRDLNKLIRQERTVRKYMAVSEYLSSQKKKQYAYFSFYPDGMRVKIRSKQSSVQGGPDSFCIRVDDKLLTNSGLPFPKAVREAYGIKASDKLNRYKEGRFGFWIEKSRVHPVEIRQGVNLNICLEGKKLEEPVCVPADPCDGTIRIPEIKGQFVISMDTDERMVMQVTPASSFSQEELVQFVTERELKELYGHRLQYLPYNKLTFLADSNRIPKHIVDMFGGSLDVSAVLNDSDGTFIATPVKTVCPFTKQQIDYTVEKPVEVTVCEETKEHLDEVAEAVQLLLVLKRQYADMEAAVSRLKKENSRSRKENAAYRRYLESRGEDPDNILIANM